MHSYTYEQLYNDTTRIIKEYFTNDIKWVTILARTGIIEPDGCETTLKVDLPYAKYLLESHIEYLIPKEYHVIHLNDDKENFMISNLGLRNEYGQNPIEMEYKLPSVIKKSVVLYPYDKTKKEVQRWYHKYKLELHLGRFLQKHETIRFKDKNQYNFNPYNLIITKNNLYKTSRVYKDVRNITGPYFLKAHSYRPYLVLNFRDGTDKKVLLSRFIMQEHLGRELGFDETVHHKDGDYFNDDLENLEVLDRVEHSINDTRRLKPVELVCQNCHKSFILKDNHLKNAYDSFAANPNYVGPFCSYECSKHLNQYNRHHYKNLLPPKQYYNLHDTFDL